LHQCDAFRITKAAQQQEPMNEALDPSDTGRLRAGFLSEYLHKPAQRQLEYKLPSLDDKGQSDRVSILANVHPK